MIVAMLSPDTVVIVCVVVVMLAFIGRAVISRFGMGLTNDVDPFDKYLLASRQLTRGDITKSMAATYTAFATVFFWFVSLGAVYGWLLFIIPLSLAVGNWLFTFYVRHFALDIPSYSTISGFVRSTTTFQPLQWLADLIVVVFLVSAVIVELVIGSNILNGLIPGVPGGTLFFLLVLAGLGLVYVVIGGFRAVVLSDAMQLYLAFFGVIALLVFALFFLKTPITGSVVPGLHSVDKSLLWAFLVSVFAVQMFGPVCQLTNWQRIAASEDYKRGLRGHFTGGVIAAFLWALMITSALILSAKLGSGPIAFETVFDNMKKGGIFPAFGLYPLVFIAFVATLMSTADSSLSGLYLVIYDRIRFSRKLQNEAFTPTWKHHIIIGIFFFGVILVFYHTARGNLLYVAFTMIYFLFNQLIVVFPLIIYLMIAQSLVHPHSASSNKSLPNAKGIKIKRFEECNLFVATLLGWCVVAAMSFIGYRTGRLQWTMYASASGVGVAGFLSIPSWYVLLRRTKFMKEPRS